ncbi:MAG: PAS domain S-box protein [Prolixibacteraceae bacterium]
MTDQKDISKEELIRELDQLRKENGSLRLLLDNKLTKIKHDELLSGNEGAVFKTNADTLPSLEAKYFNLIENINDVIYITDEQAKIIFISPSIYKLLGYSQEEIVGKNFIEFVGESITFIQGRFDELKEKRELKNEYQIQSKSGEPRWIRFSTRAIIENGQFKGSSGILIDVTETKLVQIELQKSDALYRSILQASPDSIFIADLKGNLLFTSPMTWKMIGVENQDFLVDKQLFDFLHPDDRSKALAAINNMFEGTYTGATEYVGLKADGSTFDMEVNGEFIRDPAGVPTSMIFIARDISGRKSAEKKLLKSEETYRTLVQSINDIVFDVTMDGTINYVSPSIWKTLNLRPEEMVGRNFFSFVYPEDLPFLLDIFRNNRFKEYNKIEYRCLGANGEIIWVRVSAQDKYLDGKMIGRTGILQDITEQKLAEEKLRKSEEQYRRIIESVNDVIYEIDATGVVKFVSQSVVSVLGFSVEEVLGSNIFDIIYFEDRPLIMETLANLPFKEQNHMEYRYVRKDGSIHWVRSSTASILKNGTMVGGTGILTDITERKIAQEALQRSEERFSQIAEQSKTVIWEIDPNGLYTYVNELTESVWGYSQKEIIGKKHFYDLQPEEGREEVREYAINLFKRKEIISGIESQIITKDGRWIWVSTNGVPVIDQEGNLTGYRGADIEITDRLLALKELNVAQKIGQLCSWELNLASGELFWSENYFHVMGIQVGSEMKTEYFMERVHPDDLVIVDQNFSEVLSTKKPVKYDIRIRMQDGSYNWIQNNIVPEIRDEVIVCLRGVNIDVTEKKIDEEKIRRQNERLSAILKSIPDLIFVVANDGTFLEFFASGPDKLLMPPEKIIGNNIRDVFDHDMVALFLEKFKESLDRNELVSTTYEVYLPDSGINHFEARIVPLEGEKVLILSRDVTEQVNNEIEIKKLSNVVQQSPVITVITDLKSRIEYVNPAFESITGYTMEEVVGKSSNMLKSGLTDRKTYDSLWKTIENGKEWHGEWISKRKNGELYWEEVAISTILDSNGKVINYLAIKQDISRRKKTEENLRQSEESYRLMFGNNPQPMWIYHLETLAFLEINDAAVRHYGYSREEFLSMTIIDIMPAEDVEELMKDLDKTKNNFNIEGEWRHIKKNGEIIIVEITSHAITFNDTSARHILIKDNTNRKKIEAEILDLNANLEHKIEERTSQLNELNLSLVKEIEFRKITEEALSESEKSYRMVIENVHEVIFQTNADGLWVFLNKSWEEVTGFSVSESLGVLFLNFVHEDDRQRNMELFAPLINREKDYCKHEVRYITKKGGFRWIEVYARLGLNENDEIIGTYGTLTDITERKLAVEAINEAREEAEKANFAKSEFLSRMSHELRTPMNSILGFAQLLEIGELLSGQKKSVGHILKSGKHLLDLINEVLDISRIEAGRLSLSIEPVDLKEIIQEMMETVRIQSVERELEVKLVSSTVGNLYVKSDKQRLKQILLNLLNNAIKYNRIGGSVSIKTEVISKSVTGLPSVRISISDTGMGISAEDIPRLFIPFERIGAEKTRTEGTGLGLSVVRKLIDAMGGELGVESTLDEGSTFWVELPQSEGPLDIAGILAGIECPDSQLDDSGATILYVEDNLSNIELVEQILLCQFPYIQLVTTRNGEQAVGMALEYLPDLILLDLNLPDIHGSEVMQRLLANEVTCKIPVVVISADALTKQKTRMLTDGAKKYLTKPLDLVEFIEVVNEFLVPKSGQ